MSEPGVVLSGRYRLDERVGAGGAGVVYRATDLLSSAPVAVKLLHGGGDFDRRRFDREVAILRELDHPNIVRFADDGSDPTHGAFLIMEWLEGETLTARLKRGRLSEDGTLTLGIAIASALEHAHSHGVVHRDVKPSNIWLAGGDPTTPRLLDFGISKSRSQEKLTRTGEAFGTIGYMAPEQVCADQPVDLRADVFSLGCVLFECVTGTLPFRADTPQGWLMKLALEDPLRADHVIPDVGRSLADVLAKMLAVQPPARTRSMAEVQSALRLSRTAEGAPV
ncbi:MAG: serine/threonine protein kinase, partial [Myxococcales bacterium]|nr:serine/threonine protein kinase [Myxococcales bacterium]